VLVSLISGRAMAQGSVLYDAPADAAYDELKQWGTMYVQLLESGTPSSDAATFAFSNSEMNSPLFSPVRAAMSILGEAAGTQVCSTTTIEPGPGSVDEDLVAYLTMGKITTSLNDAGATAAHLTAILNSSNVQYTIEDDVLVSVGLTPGVITTVPGAKQYTTVGVPTAEWISELGVLAPGWAAQRDFSQEGKRQLLGLPSEVEAFTGQIREWATVNGVALTMYQVQANFGSYGSLPVIVAVYESGGDSGFILIDGVNGNVDGPFVTGSSIDPRGLLVLHGGAFVVNSGIQLVDSKTGECQTAAKSWSPGLAPAYIPRPGVPGKPPYLIPPPTTPAPGPIQLHPIRPGWWSNYSCVVAGAMCQCTAYGQSTTGVPGGGIIWIRSICTAPAGGGCPPPATPNDWNPTTAPGTPGAPAFPCGIEHFN
jgi:hypothetical protein